MGSGALEQEVKAQRDSLVEHITSLYTIGPSWPKDKEEITAICVNEALRACGIRSWRKEAHNSHISYRVTPVFPGEMLITAYRRTETIPWGLSFATITGGIEVGDASEADILNEVIRRSEGILTLTPGQNNKALLEGHFSISDHSLPVRYDAKAFALSQSFCTVEKFLKMQREKLPLNAAIDYLVGNNIHYTVKET